VPNPDTAAPSHPGHMRGAGRVALALPGAPSLPSRLGAARLPSGPRAGPRNRQERHMPVVPESFVILGQVALVPLAGIAVALVAARIPATRADT
jgi:hypothetical protein